MADAARNARARARGRARIAARAGELQPPPTEPDAPPEAEDDEGTQPDPDPNAEGTTGRPFTEAEALDRAEAEIPDDGSIPPDQRPDLARTARRRSSTTPRRPAAG